VRRLRAACSSVGCVATGPLGYDDFPLPPGPHPAGSSIWLTRDGGASWTAQSIPPGAACNGDCTRALYGYPLEWVSCLSSALCRAGGGFCGSTDAVLVTHGPGQPWACVRAATACAWDSPDAADCPTSTGCYGLESTDPYDTNAVVLRSADGGTDCVGVGPEWASAVPNDIACPAALTCYLAGTRGTIAGITNGTTVTAQPTPTVATCTASAAPARPPATPWEMRAPSSPSADRQGLSSASARPTEIPQVRPRRRFPTGFPQTKRHSPAHGGTPAKVAL
jgi:hypothetical protein